MIPSGKIILAFLLATTATAQHWVGVRAGMINHAEGVFYIDQEKLQFPEARFREIPQGKSLRTGDGWVELQLGPNAFLWMGEEGALRINDTSLTNIQLMVERGSVVFEVSEQTKRSRFRILCGGAVIETRKPGFYRLDSGKSQFSVYAGKADIQLAGKKATVKQGKAALLATNLKVSKFDVQQTDRLREVAASRSQILSGVIQEARMRSAGEAARASQKRWYEERQLQQNQEQLDRIQSEMQHQKWISAEQSNSRGMNPQEGHATVMDIQRQQAIDNNPEVQRAIGQAQQQAIQSQPPPPQK
jgi:hypothetical protein